MHITLRDALVVKTINFLSRNLILEQHTTVVFTATADHFEPDKHELADTLKYTRTLRTNCPCRIL